MGKEEKTEHTEQVILAEKRKGGRPLGSKNKPIFTPLQCIEAADLLAAGATRQAVAAFLQTSVQTTYMYLKAEDIEEAKKRRTENIRNGIAVIPPQPRHKLSPGKHKGFISQVDDLRKVELLRTLLACNDYTKAAEIEKINERALYRAIPAKSLQAIQDELQAANGQPITYLGQIIEPPQIKTTAERKFGRAPVLDKHKLKAARRMLIAGRHCPDIAADFGITVSTLFRNIHLTQAEQQKAKEAREHLRQAQVKLIEGKGYAEVARTLKMARHELKLMIPPETIAAKRQEMIIGRLMKGDSRAEVSARFSIGITALARDYPQRAIKQMLLERKLGKLSEAGRAALPATLPAKADEMLAVLSQIETTLPPANPEDGVIAIPLKAAADNMFMRKGLELPFGLKPEDLWQGFLDHNQAVYASYLKAQTTDPLIDRMMMRYSVQRLTPDRLAETERDDFIREKQSEQIPGLVRDVFLLVSKPANPEQPPRVQGELWVNTYKRSDRGIEHVFVMNPQSKAKEPRPCDVFVLEAGPAKYKPLKKPILVPEPAV